jgi:hypothetical protein
LCLSRRLIFLVPIKRHPTVVSRKRNPPRPAASRCTPGRKEPTRRRQGCRLDRIHSCEGAVRGGAARLSERGGRRTSKGVESCATLEPTNTLRADAPSLLARAMCPLLRGRVHFSAAKHALSPVRDNANKAVVRGSASQGVGGVLDVEGQRAAAVACNATGTERAGRSRRVAWPRGLLMHGLPACHCLGCRSAKEAKEARCVAAGWPAATPTLAGVLDGHAAAIHLGQPRCAAETRAS